MGAAWSLPAKYVVLNTQLYTARLTSLCEKCNLYEANHFSI